jgi:hypothetical protein
MRVHEFASTGDAYDATQCRDDISNGDTLVIASERVIGIADTWPVAVTVEFGKLHTPADNVTLAQCFEDRKITAEAIEQAKQEAKARGWPVRD